MTNYIFFWLLEKHGFNFFGLKTFFSIFFDPKHYKYFDKLIYEKKKKLENSSKN
jgi:hypothetical protein